VVGLWTEADKSLLLRNAKHLEKTIFKEVTVGPDLTKRQREEEAEMRVEADRRNEQDLTEDDVAKNLKWAVVGDRGKKTLIKTVAREQRREGGRGGWREGREQERPTGTIPKRKQQGSVIGGVYQSHKEKTPVKQTEVPEESESGSEEEEEEMDTAEETETETETEPASQPASQPSSQPAKVTKKKGRKRNTRSPGSKEAAGEPPEKR